MKIDPISIVDVIKNGDIHASLITTFNATFPYYEDFLLRRLASVGCRNNVLMADQRQLSAAYRSEATRPRRAGIDYTLIPVDIPGAFHPKLCLLAGKKRANLFVGSHNLTISGFGYNREVTNHLEFTANSSETWPAIFSQTWSIVREWITSMSDRLPLAILDSAFMLDAAFSRNPLEDSSNGEATFVAQYPGRDGLLDQITQLVSGKVIRITVIGAFFDAHAEFLVELLRRWPQCRLIVGIDPETVWLVQIPSNPRLTLVDASHLGPSNKQGNGYLHAKAIFIEVAGGRNLFASGSANPSEPAWLSKRNDSNVEAILVRTGPAADQCAKKLALGDLSAMPKITAAQVKNVAKRSRRIETQRELGPRVVVGIADHRQCTITIHQQDLLDTVTLVPLDDFDTRIPNADVVKVSPDTIRIACNLSDIRSLLATNGDEVIARVLIHHPEVIARRVLSMSHEPAIDLLRQLGSADADISRILPHIEKLIFADVVAATVCPPGHLGEGIGEDRSSSKPATREVSLAQMSRRRRQSLFSSSSDLATLIDVLTNHIPVVNEKLDRGIDPSGRTEEEQIGQDDDEPESIPGNERVNTLFDQEIAEQICKRVGKLCQRMSNALQVKTVEPKFAAALVVQLVAVLAVLQELDSLSLVGRWRHGHFALLPDESMESLLYATSSSLFSPGDPRLSMVAGQNPTFPEEIHQLHALMLWLAWWCGARWTSPIERIDFPEKAIEDAERNGALVRLLALAGNDSAAWEAARRFVDQTLRPTPMSASAANRWFERHQRVSEQLATLQERGKGTVDESILPGDVVTVPQCMKEPTVALSNSGKYISVLADGEEKRFLAGRVVKLARI